MPPATIQSELAAFGPAATPADRMALPAAQAYCRRFAQSHYENFTVASWLLPAHLAQHFANVYAWCRWADDLADEIDNPQQSLALLAWWEESLHRCYMGDADHPVYIALAETIREFEIPRDPFQHLLTAFRQDQVQTRYETYEDLLGYCRHSANPVGHLVLYLGRCYNPLTEPPANALCTGLQLANHWQDVARDYRQGRVYLPQEDLRHCGVNEAMLGERAAGLEVSRLLEMEVERATLLLNESWPLVTLVSRELKIEVELFIRGGLAVCEAIRRQHYDVLARRPTISKWQKLQLFGRTWLGGKLGWRREHAA